MFRKCMRNYYRNLKFIFTVLGVMFLAFLIGICFFAKKTGADFTAMSEQLAHIWQCTDFAIFGVEGGFEQVLENYSGFFGGVAEALMEEFVNLLAGIALFIGIQLAGIFSANMTVFLFGRYGISHANIFRVLLEQLSRSLLILIVWLLITAAFMHISSDAGMVLVCLYPLWYCFVALLSAWMTAGKSRRPRWKEYVSVRNMLVLFSANLLQKLISLVLGVLTFYIFDSLVAVVVCVSILIVVSATTNLNAYSMLYEGGLLQKAPEETASSPSKPEAVPEN